MGQFDDLTPQQAEHICSWVALQRKAQTEGLMLLATEEAAWIQPVPKGQRLPNAPQMISTYTALARMGYIHVEQGTHGGLLFHLLRRAFDLADYEAKAPCGRWTANLRWDLAHNDTIRSRFMWHGVSILISIVLANVGTIIMHLLGWI